MQPHYPPRLLNDRAAGIMGVGDRTVGGVLKRGVRSQGLFGAGQIIAICDSGLDTGTLANLNEDFRGRILRGIPLGRGAGGQWDDRGGHGTHVAGSVLGSGINSGANPLLRRYDASHAGTAPEASAIIQALDFDDENRDGDFGIPADLYNLFIEPYASGARVHTNSWGCRGVQGLYLAQCAQVDQFIWDYPDMVALFGGGNEGVDLNNDGVVDLGSIGIPATAKNIIAIGASEGFRPPSEPWGGFSRRTWGDLAVRGAPPVHRFSV